MRLEKIVVAARNSAIELKSEADVIGALDLTGKMAVDVKTIENARRGFQAVLKECVGLLGELPKTREELAEKECSNSDVVKFMEAFRTAVLEELQRCEFLDESSSKPVYGRFLATASNSFLVNLRESVYEENGESASTGFPQEIKFDVDMMRRTEHIKTTGAAIVEVKSKPNSIIGSDAEYQALMTRLRAEGKIL